METVYYLVLVPMVYVAFGIFFLGIVFRLVKIMRAPRNPSTLQIFPEKRLKWPLFLYDTFLMPTVRRHKPVLWAFLMAFHIAFLLLTIGHLELIREFQIFQLIEHDVFLGRGFIGLIMSIALLYFLIQEVYFTGSRSISSRRLLSSHPPLPYSHLWK